MLDCGVPKPPPACARPLAALLLLLTALPARADADDSEIIRQMRELESLRKPARLIEEPSSVSVVSGEEITRARPAADLQEALDLVPGVFAQSSRNYAQDTRVSIRGYGARATFGIRGIRVMVDGVPNTLPDGQTELDSIDVGFIERMEVVRGPNSSLYGGGAGGIISIFTPQPTEEPTLNARTTFGSDHFSRYEVMARGRHAGTGYVVGLARTRTSGYRDHSRASQTVLLTKLQRTVGDGTDLGLSFSSVWAPEAQDPGGLTAAQVADDRKQARLSAAPFDAGEDLGQQKIAFTLRHPVALGQTLHASAYTLWRDFDNKLPFLGADDGAQVDLDRNVVGGHVRYEQRRGRLQLSTGLDVDVQRDRRKRYVNDSGVRGELRIDQSEDVTAVGPFAQAELDLGGGWAAVGGLRYDWIEFDLDDHFSSDGDQSDDIRFRELSPRLALRWSPRPELSFYGNVSTAFEVPTTLELRPETGGGFDTDRDAQTSTGFEIGAKGRIGDRLLFDLVLFQIQVDDVIVPFENAAGDRFFRNAGESRRRGVELGLSAELRPGVSMRAGYTLADYRYTDYDFVQSDGTVLDFSGNREPNTPKSRLAAELRMEHRSGLFAILALQHWSDIYVNDANTAESDGATITDARFGYDWRRGETLIRPFFGVRNWSNVGYDGSLRPNAGRDRYYEPAPEIEVYGGLEIRHSFGD